MSPTIDRLLQGERLSVFETEHLFHQILAGEIDQIRLSAILIALKVRGESVDELTGAANAAFRQALPFPRPDYSFADIVGTGGDGSNSINISTASAFLAAACGCKIAKHGNGGVTSRSGSSDLLRAFGIALDKPAAKARTELDELNLCFLAAPHYHRGFQFAAPVRARLKTRTIFNLLGPLLNPAKPPLALIGVYHPALLLPFAETAKRLGYQRVAIVHGAGMDEVAVHGVTEVAELKDGEISSYQLTADSFGLGQHSLQDLVGGTPQQNCGSITNLLQGHGPEAHNHAVIANVAMLMRLFGHEDLQQNARRAAATLASGRAWQVLCQLQARC